MNDPKPELAGGVKVHTLPCCACAGKVSFADPETTENSTFFHTMPYCVRFEATNTGADLVQYLKDCVDYQTEIERP